MIATIVHQLTRDLTPEESKPLTLVLTILTTPLPYGHRLPVVFHRMPVNSSPKAIRLLTLWKIWLQRVRLYKDNIEVLKESSR